MSRATIYKLCGAGELPHIRVSNAIRISVAAIELLGSKMQVRGSGL